MTVSANRPIQHSPSNGANPLSRQNDRSGIGSRSESPGLQRLETNASTSTSHGASPIIPFNGSLFQHPIRHEASASNSFADRSSKAVTRPTTPKGKASLVGDDDVGTSHQPKTNPNGTSEETSLKEQIDAELKETGEGLQKSKPLFGDVRAGMDVSSSNRSKQRDLIEIIQELSVLKKEAREALIKKLIKYLSCSDANRSSSAEFKDIPDKFKVAVDALKAHSSLFGRNYMTRGATNLFIILASQLLDSSDSLTKKSPQELKQHLLGVVDGDTIDIKTFGDRLNPSYFAGVVTSTADRYFANPKTLSFNSGGYSFTVGQELVQAPKKEFTGYRINFTESEPKAADFYNPKVVDYVYGQATGIFYKLNGKEMKVIPVHTAGNELKDMLSIAINTPSTDNTATAEENKDTAIQVALGQHSEDLAKFGIVNKAYKEKLSNMFYDLQKSSSKAISILGEVFRKVEVQQEKYVYRDDGKYFQVTSGKRVPLGLEDIDILSAAIDNPNLAETRSEFANTELGKMVIQLQQHCREKPPAISLIKELQTDFVKCGYEFKPAEQVSAPGAASAAPETSHYDSIYALVSAVNGGPAAVDLMTATAFTKISTEQDIVRDLANRVRNTKGDEAKENVIIDFLGKTIEQHHEAYLRRHGIKKGSMQDPGIPKFTSTDLLLLLKANSFIATDLFTKALGKLGNTSTGNNATPAAQPTTTNKYIQAIAVARELGGHLTATELCDAATRNCTTEETVTQFFAAVIAEKSKHTSTAALFKAAAAHNVTDAEKVQFHNLTQRFYDELHVDLSKQNSQGTRQETPTEQLRENNRYARLHTYLPNELHFNGEILDAAITVSGMVAKDLFAGKTVKNVTFREIHPGYTQVEVKTTKGVIEKFQNKDAKISLDGGTFDHVTFPDNCDNISFTGATLTNVDLSWCSGVDLSRARIGTGCKLPSDCTNISFAGATIEQGVTISDSNNLNLSDAKDFTKVTFNNCQNLNLSGKTITDSEFLGDCTGISFTGATLTNVDLRGCRGLNLSGATIGRGCKLPPDCTNISFAGATIEQGVTISDSNNLNLSGATLDTGCTFNNCQNLNLRGKMITGGKFSGDCTGINFVGATLTNVDLSWCSGVDLSRARIGTGCKLPSDCTNISFAEATIEQGVTISDSNNLNLSEATIGTGCTFNNCQNLNLRGKMITGGKFSGNCTGINFVGATLTNVDLSGCSGLNLSGATLGTGCKLPSDCTNISFAGATFNGVDFTSVTNVHLSGTIIGDGCKLPVGCTGFVFENMDCSKLNFVGKTLQNTRFNDCTNLDLKGAVVSSDCTFSGFTETNSVTVDDTTTIYLKSSTIDTEKASLQESMRMNGLPRFITEDKQSYNIQHNPGSTLANTTIENKTIDKKTFINMSLTGVKFVNCTITGDVFESCKFTDCTFESCRFTNARITFSGWNGCTLNGCSLTSTSITFRPKPDDLLEHMKGCKSKAQALRSCAADTASLESQSIEEMGRLNRFNNCRLSPLIAAYEVGMAGQSSQDIFAVWEFVGKGKAQIYAATYAFGNPYDVNNRGQINDDDYKDFSNLNQNQRLLAESLLAPLLSNPHNGVVWVRGGVNPILSSYERLEAPVTPVTDVRRVPVKLQPSRGRLIRK